MITLREICIISDKCPCQEPLVSWLCFGPCLDAFRDTWFKVASSVGKNACENASVAPAYSHALASLVLSVFPKTSVGPLCASELGWGIKTTVWGVCVCVVSSDPRSDRWVDPILHHHYHHCSCSPSFPSTPVLFLFTIIFITSSSLPLPRSVLHITDNNVCSLYCLYFVSKFRRQNIIIKRRQLVGFVCTLPFCVCLPPHSYFQCEIIKWKQHWYLRIYVPCFCLRESRNILEIVIFFNISIS